MKKQFLAKLLVLCMVITMIPVAVFAATGTAPAGANEVYDDTYDTGNDTYGNANDVYFIGGSTVASSDKVTGDDLSTSGGTTVVEVKVESKTTGTTSTATVSEADMSKAVDNVIKTAAANGTVPKIVVDVETADEATAVKVNLPVKSLKTLSEVRGATLSVTSDVADVELDNTATVAVAEQTKGSTVTIAVQPVATASLSSAQREAVQDAAVIDVSILGGNEQIVSFNGGKITVSVAYALPSGVSSADVQVYYLTDKGILQAHETSYARGKVTFVTTHLSKYVIGTKTLSGMIFTDVAFGQYYYDAVAWAAKNKIAAGVSSTLFAPGQTCTRAQIVTFLWRAAGSPEPVSNDNPFTDVDSSAYYYKAVMWAVRKGITAGTSETTFSPGKTCTRAEAMAFMYRAAGSPAASGTGTFSDVSANAYYSSAVAWAVQSNITAGTSSTTFSPSKTCSRAEIVTFLYRSAL